MEKPLNYKSLTFLTKTRIDVQSGLFVKVTVNGIRYNILIDTGANLTILFHKVYENISKSRDKLIPQNMMLSDKVLLHA